MTDVLDQKRNGISLADCAQIMDQLSALRTELGEPGYKDRFQQFLRSKGLTEATWGQVWNDWYEVMQNDPSLAAKFHTYQAQVSNNRIIAGQPNVSGESMEGLSLEAYAKISARSQTGAPVEGLVAEEGLTMDQWLKGQAAWGARMGSVSPTDPIIMQYGQLYQKYSPNHQAMMEATTQKFLEDAAERDGTAGGMSKALTVENAHEFFSHANIRTRTRGAREMMNLWDRMWNDRTPQMRELTAKAYAISVDLLNQGAGTEGVINFAGDVNSQDIHAFSKMIDEEEAQQGTIDTVVGPLKDLAAAEFMSSAQSEQAQAALRNAISRLQPRAQKVEQLFGVATDELKKTQLRTLLDDYRSTLESLQEAIDDWSYTGPSGETSGEASDDASAGAAPSFGGASVSAGAPGSAIAPAKPTNGLIVFLKGLPIIGQILKALGF